MNLKHHNPLCHKLINCSGRVSEAAKKGKFTVLLCVRKHNKSAVGLKGRMTRTFFFYFSLFTLLTAYFIVCLLSLPSYPASPNPSPLRIHKASSYLFTRFLTALFFFFPHPFCLSGGSPGWKTLPGLFRVSPFSRETHGSPAPFLSSGGIRRNWFVLLCLPSICTRPSLYPALLPAFCPCLLSWEEEGRHVPACINTPD